LVTVEKAAADLAAAVEVDASEKEAVEKVAAEPAEKTAATWLPRYIAIEVADKGHEESATKKAAAKKAAAKKAAAEKAAALKAAAEKDAAEKAAAEKAATEQAPPREWWQPPDWMGVTAKPSGDAAKAEAEKAEAAEAAAAAARSPSPLANGTPGRAYNLGSPLANGTPGRAYNLGGYKAPPPSRTKAELEANLESERQKGRPRPSTTLRLPLSPDPWLGGGSVSPERSEQARSRRLQSKSTWLASRSDRAESSRPTTGTKALGEPSYWSALGWRSWRES
jgi:hypothetical protein